jgi:hypothetical protein
MLNKNRTKDKNIQQNGNQARTVHYAPKHALNFH